MSIAFKKTLETELDYWQAIENIGAYLQVMYHGISRGHIEKNESVAKDIEETKADSRQLAEQVYELFGVISVGQTPIPKAGEEKLPPSEGKIYYWDWYYKQKRLYFEGEYPKIICSACPFSEGVEVFQNRVPCSKYEGTAWRLSHPSLCLMLTRNKWNRDRLLYEIRVKAGTRAVNAFVAKEAELKTRE